MRDRVGDNTCCSIHLWTIQPLDYSHTTTKSIYAGSALYFCMGDSLPTNPGQKATVIDVDSV